MTLARLYQLDGRVSLALMRLSAHHKILGHEVELVHAGNKQALEQGIFDQPADFTYASLIFTKTRPLAERLLQICPDAIVGGTGWDFGKPASERATLEKLGVARAWDYSLYPTVTYSLGYLQRGCRLRCGFCDVWRAEGTVRPESSVLEVWRGDPWPRHLVLLDNDPFGSPRWERDFEFMRSNGFRVCLQQGFNARLIGRSHAAEIAGLDYRAEDFKTKRLYCAWDNRGDEKKLMRGLGYLTDAGVLPNHILVYVLVGFDHKTEAARPLNQDDFYRVNELRDFGAFPYPMPFHRSRELVGFQRWVVRDYDKRGVSWSDFVAAELRPENLNHAGVTDPQESLFA